MNAGKALTSVVVVFAGTVAAHWALAGARGGPLLEVVAVCAIAWAAFSLGIGRIRWPFFVLVTAVFVALRAADLYWLRAPLLSGPLSWLVVPAVVAGLLLAGRRYFFAG